MEAHRLAQRKRSSALKDLKIELSETLANELNNSDWEFGGRRVVSAATDYRNPSLVIALSDGKTIEYFTLDIRRNHGRKRPQARHRTRTARLRRKKR